MISYSSYMHHTEDSTGAVAIALAPLKFYSTDADIYMNLKCVIVTAIRICPLAT